MVLLVATDRILAALEAVPDSQRSELNLPSTLQLHEPITHDQLLRLAKHLQHDAAYTATIGAHNRSTVLNTLLHGTKVYVPPPPKKPEPVRAKQSRSLTIQPPSNPNSRAPNTSPQKPASSPKPKEQPTSAASTQHTRPAPTMPTRTPPRPTQPKTPSPRA